MIDMILRKPECQNHNNCKLLNLTKLGSKRKLSNNSTVNLLSIIIHYSDPRSIIDGCW